MADSFYVYAMHPYFPKAHAYNSTSCVALVSKVAAHLTVYIGHGLCTGICKWHLYSNLTILPVVCEQLQK